MSSEKQYKYFKAQVAKYEAQRKKVTSIAIQTDETPENTLIESLNEMRDRYREMEKSKNHSVSLAVGEAYYLVNEMIEQKRTKQYIKNVCEQEMTNNGW